MKRTLYRWLMALHPPAFRRRFGEEILAIFDQADAAGAALPLYYDVLLSLARQWLLRSGSWKLAVAAAGAFAQILIITWATVHYGQRRISSSLAEAGPVAGASVGLETVLPLTAVLFAGIALLVLLTVLQIRALSNRRTPLHRRPHFRTHA